MVPFVPPQNLNRLGREWPDNIDIPLALAANHHLVEINHRPLDQRLPLAQARDERELADLFVVAIDLVGKGRVLAG